MEAWEHEIGDVLLITRKGQEVIARVAGYFDSLDNTKPLLVNLRIAGGQAWGSRLVKALPGDIIKALPEWQKERDAWFEQSIKEAADRAYAKMSPLEKQRLAEQAEKRRRRNALDILIDRACGLE